MFRAYDKVVKCKSWKGSWRSSSPTPAAWVMGHLWPHPQEVATQPLLEDFHQRRVDCCMRQRADGVGWQGVGLLIPLAIYRQ